MGTAKDAATVARVAVLVCIAALVWAAAGAPARGAAVDSEAPERPGAAAAE
jgi:hypothetical protein